MLEVDVDVRQGSFTLRCNLAVRRGRVVALIGSSGAGKSTLLRSIAGLVRPRAGRIVSRDERWFDSSAGIFAPPQARSCAMVFPEYALFGHLSVLENAAFGLRAAGLRATPARAKAREVLELVGLSDRAGRRAASLSSGEMQRVAIARALATSPHVLLLDEPLSAIDVERRAPVRDMLKKAIAGSEAAAVIVTHDPVEAMLFAEELLVLQRGAVIQRGSAADLRSRPNSTYVAAFAGVNLFRGSARPGSSGTSAVDVDGVTFSVLGSWSGPVALVLEPDAVVLSKTKPESSARNCLAGPVLSCVSDGNAVRVSVGSLPPVTARITSQASAELDIRPQMQVVATFKASEVRVV